MCVNLCKLSLVSRLFSDRTLENRIDTKSKSKRATETLSQINKKTEVPSTSNLTPQVNNVVATSVMLLLLLSHFSV